MSAIKVVQVNIQHKRTAAINLCRIVQTSTADIALVQEPYFRHGRFYVGNLVNPNFVAFSKEGMTNPRIMPRACILLSNAINGSLVPSLTTRDICVVLINVKVGNVDKQYVYCSAYFPHDMASPTEDFKKVVSHCDKNNLPLIVGSDANAHHIVWGSSDINPRGLDLMEYLCSTNLNILNIGNIPTFVKSNREEVLDITLCTNKITHEVNNWRVSEEESLADHRFIFFDHMNGCMEIFRFRNPRNTDWSVYTDTLASKFHGYQPSIEGPDDLDDVVEITTSNIIEAFEEACPLRTIKSTRGTPWWNTELSKLRKMCRRAWNRRRTEGVDAFKLARKAYKKALKSAERQGWKNLCTNVSSVNETSRLNKVLAKSNDFQVNCIRDEAGNFSNDDDEVLENLFRIHFPGCLDLEPFINPDHFSAHFESWATARRLVTPESIKWALNSFSPYKTPGADGIYPCLLQKGFDYFKNILKQIFVCSLATGYIPKSWREINVKFIPKGGRATYDEAKSFRPISLSSFMLKCLERIIDHNIRSESLSRHPLHEMQHAYQRGKSTITLLHHVVHDIEKAFSQKQSCLGVFLDIEGAFDNVSFNAIIEAALFHGVPSVIASWIHEMLKNRYLNSSLRRAYIRKQCIKGCPQGGVLSPLLWNLVADGLLRKLNSLGFPSYGFADDYLTMIVGLCVNTIFDLMQQALREIEEWCSEIGLSVNPNKTTLVLFTNKRRITGVRPLCFFGSEVCVTDQVKYLGVILDSKLNWSAHIDFRIKKACMAFGQCRRTIGKSWGLKPKYIYWIYTAIVRPILAYGCLVWWQKGEMRTIQTKLNHLQRMCLMALSGAFSSTPTAALEALFNIRPLQIFLKQEAYSCAYRFQANGLWYHDPNNNSSHTRLWSHIITWDKFVLAPSDVTLPISFPNSDLNISFPLRSEWTSGYVERTISNNIIVFTDGSLLDGKAGAGVYSQELRLQQSYSLGTYCTVFQAEIFAIICGVQGALQQKVMGKIIYFCSDSQAAIKAIGSNNSRSKLVIACRTQLEELSSVNAVHLLWVPGHSNIAGNEWADELARNGASIDFVGPEPAVPISVCWIKQKICSWALSEHNRLWADLDTCRQTKLFLSGLSPKVSNYLLNLSKNNCSTLVRTITGHCNLNYHLANIQRAESFACDLCEADYGTPFHLICSCPAIAQLRYKIFGHHLLDESNYKNLDLKNILQFISRCGKEL